MGETISIEDMMKILRKRWKSIVVLSLLVVTIGAYVTYFLLTPVYQASTLILVNQKGVDEIIDTAQLRSNVEFINTYSVIIKSPVILEKVKDELQLDDSVKQLNRKINIESEFDSFVFSVTIEDSNPELAVRLANTISETFQREIKEIMNVDNVNILARAELEDEPAPIKPLPLFNMVIASVVGLLVGMVFALIREYLDNTLKDSTDVEEFLGLPVLGSIEKLHPKQSEKSNSIYQKAGETIEA